MSGTAVRQERTGHAGGKVGANFVRAKFSTSSWGVLRVSCVWDCVLMLVMTEARLKGSYFGPSMTEAVAAASAARSSPSVLSNQVDYVCVCVVLAAEAAANLMP